MVEHAAAGSQPMVHFYTPLLPTMLDPKALIRERDGKLLWMNRFYIEATPSTGLIGSAPDVAKFMMMYLNRGMLNGESILSPESIATLTETAPIDSRGLGWYIGETNGEHDIDHAGGGPGFATIMRIYPESGIGVAILSNGTDLDRNGLADLLRNTNYE